MIHFLCNNNKCVKEIILSYKTIAEDKEDETIFHSSAVKKQSSYTMPVTYTWENIEAEVETVQGNIFKRRNTRNRILDNGNIFLSIKKYIVKPHHSY